MFARLSTVASFMPRLRTVSIIPGAWEQLWGGICAVFDSWMNERAILYRRMNQIPEEWGTAVNVQAMVYGNMGENSATGVAFSRDAATGENLFNGEYLINAQGEDVVAGIRTPQQITLEGSRRWAALQGISEDERKSKYCTFAIAGLEHPKFAVLDCELHVLHILVMFFKIVGDFEELLSAYGHGFFERRIFALTLIFRYALKGSPTARTFERSYSALTRLKHGPRKSVKLSSSALRHLPKTSVVWLLRRAFLQCVAA